PVPSRPTSLHSKESVPSVSCFNLLFLFLPGNVSRNCTSQGWSDVYPAPYVRERGLGPDGLEWSLPAERIL
uniref:Uncharacterized protein n=1 Tax=Pavo cristatus TaxID=9049 RepID=A0A8C9F600_PAVCR